MKKWMLGGALSVVVLGAGWGISQSLPTGAKLSKNFENATAQSLVDWLKQQGVEMDANKVKLDPNARFSISLKDVDKTSAIRAIAGALGYWVDEQGGKYSLRGSRNAIVVGPDGTTPWGPDAELKIEKAFGPDFQKKMEDWGKDLEKRFGPEFQKHMEDWGKDFEKRMQEWGGKMKEFKIVEGSPNSPTVRIWADGKELDPKKIKEFRMKPGKAYKMVPSVPPIPPMPAMPSMPDMPDIKIWAHGKDLDPAKMKEIEEHIRKAMEGMPKLPDIPAMPHAMRIDSQNWDKLIASLTAEQWAKQKSQGFLKPSDLTADQRKMVSIPDGDGDFNITITKDGKTLTIKKG